jgi:hypothetical protein
MPETITKNRLHRQTGFTADNGANVDRRIVFCAYPYEVDRDGTTIPPEAWVKWLPTYMTNPLVSFAHPMDWDEPSEKLPVGKAVRAWIETGSNATNLKPGLYAEVEFATHDFAEDVYQCYKGGFLNAVSIMGYPHAMSFDPVLPGQTGPTYTEIELMDISCVPLPSARNALAQRSPDMPEALVKAYSRVEQVLTRAGKEISAKNMTKLKDMHSDMVKIKDNFVTHCDTVKEFIDSLEVPAPVTEGASTTTTTETIERTVSTSTTDQPSDQASADTTREAATGEETTNPNQPSEVPPITPPVTNWLDAWLERQSTAKGVTKS